MKKDIDLLKKRSRVRRDLMERAGSTGLALSGLIGLLFLTVLVWQIAKPTFIDGESGQIEPASEFIPVSDYILKWDYPTVDDNGDLIGNAVVLELSWNDGSPQTHEIVITVTGERGLKEDIIVDSTGVSTNAVEVGKKTKFYLLSSLDVPVTVEQVSGPVPAADSTGAPAVGTFVISGEVDLLLADGSLVSTPLEIAAWVTLFGAILLISVPMPKMLERVERLGGKERAVKYGPYLLAAATLVLGAFTLDAWLGALCWFVVGVILVRLLEGLTRLRKQGRDPTQFDRLKHSITNRESLLMWAKMLFVFSMLFIPLAITIPFLTERYQDIFIPYASGIRSAFFGTIWVMAIAMLVSMPVSIGAAIYLEEYARPTRTTKLIQALVTNLAGVPSIVFGMFGLAIFVKQGGVGLGLGPSILAAGLTMGVMAMPIIVLASQEALRSVPRSLRESAYGVGCTQWQVTRDHVLPSAMPGIMTGSILAMSRIMGEAAPLVVVGAAALVLFDPEPLAGLTGGNVNFTVIPIQIYFWTSEADQAFHSMAAAASITLIVLLAAMNSVAIILREHFRRRLNP
jgi:phosphate transport system permease protein